MNFSQFPFNYEIRKKKKIESTTKENSQGKFIYINSRRSGRKKKYYYYYYHYHYYKPVTVLHYTIRNVIKILRIEYFTSPRSTVNKIKRGGGRGWRGEFFARYFDFHILRKKGRNVGALKIRGRDVTTRLARFHQHRANSIARFPLAAATRCNLISKVLADDCRRSSSRNFLPRHR